jgi:hypothetical protein
MFFSFLFHTDNIVTFGKKIKNRGKKITDTPSAPRSAFLLRTFSQFLGIQLSYFVDIVICRFVDGWHLFYEQSKDFQRRS